MLWRPPGGTMCGVGRSVQKLVCAHKTDLSLTDKPDQKTTSVTVSSG